MQQGRTEKGGHAKTHYHRPHSHITSNVTFTKMLMSTRQHNLTLPK